jgi:O-antigen ligase
MFEIPLAALLVAAAPLAWLLPNHYYPWPSAWQDGLAIALLVAGALACRRPLRLPVIWSAVLAAALASIALQWASGRIMFGGDALLAAMYLLTFGLALAVGCELAAPSSERATDSFLTALAVGVLVSAALSVAIAIVQWSGAISLGVWGVDLKPGGRPYANVAQPNHFSTIAFLGLCAAALLREQRRIGTPVLLVLAVWLMGGMAMSGSRTGWLQIALLVGLVSSYSRRIDLAVGPRLAIGFAGLFIVLALAWPWFADLAAIGGARAAQDQLQAGTRWAHWQAMLDAISREPWFGYGWQQVVAAQQAVAIDHPPVGEHIEHSHNIVLDLLVWAGVPLGGLVVLLVVIALWRTFTAARDPRVVWLLAGVGGLLVHANLELPLEYAYFLVPMGLALGAAHALSQPVAAKPPGRVRIPTLPLAGAMLGALLAVVAIDYLEAEENMRMLRLESARIGVSKLETPAPKLRVLDQLQAHLEFARTEARPGMSADELRWMGRVSTRFGYAPVMFRYAIAAGLNRDPAGARLTLARLCSIHPPARCDESHAAWLALQQRYPVLRDVNAPTTQSMNSEVPQDWREP